MRILSVGNFGHGWDGSVCDEEHIAKALEELGHEVYRLQREDMAKYENGVPNSSYYDFTLIAQWDGYSRVDWLPRPLVYWAFDYQADGQVWHEKLIDKADLYLSKRLADSKYPNWQWLSQDFAPRFLDKYQPGVSVDDHLQPSKGIDILFTGSYLDWAKERNETIRAVNDKFNLVIHSVNAWPEEWNLDVRPPIMDEGLPELYAWAKVILSIDHTLEAGYWSDRNAQIIACGGRPLFRYVPLSEARFDTRVDYFYNIEDCLKQIEHRLINPWQYKQNMDGLFVTHRVLDLLTIVGAYV